MMTKPLFMEYPDMVLFDEEGRILGIKPEAPEEVKKSYEDYQKVREEARKKGIKL